MFTRVLLGGTVLALCAAAPGFAATETLTLSDGSMRVVHADGAVRLVHPDGTATVVYGSDVKVPMGDVAWVNGSIVAQPGAGAVPPAPYTASVSPVVGAALASPDATVTRTTKTVTDQVGGTTTTSSTQTTRVESPAVDPMAPMGATTTTTTKRIETETDR